jgi:hypothetical protein
MHTFTIEINGHRFRLAPNQYPLYVCDHCHIAVEIRRKGDHEPMLASVPSCEEIRAQRLKQHPRKPEPDPEELEADAERLGWTIEDAKHWLAAIRKWRKAGKPVRSSARVKQILEAHCKPCKHYATEWGGRCRLCRCCVNASKMAQFNRLRMANLGCDDGRFGPDC